MKRNFFISSIVLLLSITVLKAESNNNTFNPDDTYVFIAGVLKWQDPGLSPFSARNRKDEELYNLLLSKGIKKENTVFLKDSEATLANMKSGINRLLQKTSSSSTFIFYYAGHGIRGGNGPVCLANYDISGEAGTGFEVTIVSDLVNSSFRGKNVWLFADCCYSGTLMDEAKKISKGGKPVIAFTSSSSSNVSTGNWTFTQTMIDCFKGLPAGDHNGDGKITIGEVKNELFDAMKFRESQLSGTVFYNTDEYVQFNLSSLQPGTGGKKSAYCYVLQTNRYEPARIISNNGNTITGELYHYSDKATVTVPVKNSKPIEFMEFPKGKKVEVEWNGKRYPAEIMEARNGFHLIHYTGYDDSWNEWVMYSRIHTNERKKCSVEWQGGWYPGEVLQQKDGKYFVHYTGYGSDWDEWVGPERVKL